MSNSKLKEQLRLRGRAFFHGIKLFVAGITGNEDVIGRYIPINGNPDDFHISHLGSDYKGVIIYKICNIGNGFGFFAEFKMLLLGLLFADKYGFIPSVEFNTDFLYYDSDMSKIDNPFEYYFEPIGGAYNTNEAMNVIQSKIEYSYSMECELNPETDGYHNTDELSDQLALVISKYIRIKPDLKKEFDDEFMSMCGNQKVLGVHYRGTDFKMEYNKHPAIVTIDQTIENVKKQLNTKGYQLIYLATDDKDAVLSFRRSFGEKLVLFDDVPRSDGNKSIARSENSRYANHYKLGKEVLRDMYFLSKCDGLVCGLSQVSYAARLFKMSRGENYCSMTILDNGINNNYREYVEDYDN